MQYTKLELQVIYGRWTVQTNVHHLYISSSNSTWADDLAMGSTWVLFRDV